MIRQQVLAGILWPEREPTYGGYSAKFKARPVRVKNATEDAFFDVVEPPLTSRGFLRLQMLRFFLFRIGHRLGPRGAAYVLRECAKRTGDTARDEKHGELSGKSNSHGHLS